MHKSTIALAFLATLSIVATAHADDFSALLADLSFGDAPSLNETLTLTDPPEQHQLRQAPTELVMPEYEAPTVSLQEPVADEIPQPAAQIDLDAVFSLQESQAGVEAQAACHLLDHDKQGSCDEGSCDEGFCEEGIICTPHTAPNMPTSSFYQYFRSSKCNSHVWDGYRQHCRSSNKHLNGTCDCFKVKEKKKKEDCCGPIYDAPVAQCTDCNAGPRRKFLPVKKSCNDCTTCETSCDTGCDS